MDPKRLKLRAEDAEDIEVVSAVLQDAIVPFSDITYQADAKMFVLVVQRFCWCAPPEKLEEGAVTEDCFERIRCAVSIEGVASVQLTGIDQTKRGLILELLAVVQKDDEMRIVFAGQAEIRLKLEKWRLKMEDFGEPWPTFHQPIHAM